MANQRPHAFSASRLHPATWWLLALAGVQAATMSHSPVDLALQCLVMVAITLACREAAPWARSMRFYVLLATAVIAIRVLVRALFGIGVLDAAALLGGVTDGLRLAAILLSVALATTLANPRRLLASTPGALYEIATAVTVALNLAPELINSLQRGRRLAALRGRSRGLGALRGIVIPTLESALDNSLALAASMESRGFGSRATEGSRTALGGRIATIAAVLLWCLGIYSLFAVGDQLWLGAALLALGLALAVTGLALGSRGSVRTRLVVRRLVWQDSVVAAIALTWWLTACIGALTPALGWR